MTMSKLLLFCYTNTIRESYKDTIILIHMIKYNVIENHTNVKEHSTKH